MKVYQKERELSGVIHNPRYAQHFHDIARAEDKRQAGQDMCELGRCDHPWHEHR